MDSGGLKEAQIQSYLAGGTHVHTCKGTLAPPGKCDWTVHMWRQCGFMSNYFDHLLLLAIDRVHPSVLTNAFVSCSHCRLQATVEWTGHQVHAATQFNVRRSLHKWVTKWRHSINLWNMKNPKHTFCGEFARSLILNVICWKSRLHMSEKMAGFCWRIFLGQEYWPIFISRIFGLTLVV